MRLNDFDDMGDGLGEGQGRSADDLFNRMSAYAYLCVAILSAALAVWIGS